MAKLLFISNGVFENLGIEYISAFLKNHGHKVNVVIDPSIFSDTFHTCRHLANIFSFRKMILNEIFSHKPDMICFSVLTDTYQWAVGLAEEIKKHLDVLVVFGGVHPTLLPKLVIQNKSIDIVCVGEGEMPLLELANNLDKGIIDYTVENLWFKRNGEVMQNPSRRINENLDSLPFPDKEVFYNINNKYRYEYMVVTGRGCPFECSYCCNHSMKNILGVAYIRKRTVDNLLEELVCAKSRYAMRYVWFTDDMFFLDKEWLYDFSEKYSRHVKLPFFCYAHPEQIDEEVAELLKIAGCYEIGLGVQTISPLVKEAVLRNEPVEHVRDAIMLLKKAGILVVTENIVGLPYGTENDLLELLNFYNDNKPAMVIMNWLRIFPETHLLDFERGKNTHEEIHEKIEKGKDTQIGWKRNISDIRTARKLAFLLELSPSLPKRIIKLIVDNKLYNFIPCRIIYASYLVRILRFSSLGKLLYGKAPYDSGARIYVRNYAYFIFRKLRCFIIEGSKIGNRAFKYC